MELLTGALSYLKCHHPIWRVLASSLGISSWTPLKSQHCNPNPNPYWLPYSSHTFHHPSQTPCSPWVSYSPQKTYTWCMQDGPKAVWSIQYVSVAFFPSLKKNFIPYRSSKVSSRPDCIFEIPQLNQSVFSRVSSNSYCSSLFKAEIIEIGQ